jgi:hypothetical protein
LGFLFTKTLEIRIAPAENATAARISTIKDEAPIGGFFLY